MQLDSTFPSPTTPTSTTVPQSTISVGICWRGGWNTSRSRRMVLLTVVAEGVLNVQAPPATTFLHPRHFQIPAASRFTESLPQNFFALELDAGILQRRYTSHVG